MMLNKEEALERWKQANREDRDRIYAEVILPLFKEEFASKPLEGWPYEEKPEIDALISVLGFSWCIFQSNSPPVPVKVSTLCGLTP